MSEKQQDASPKQEHAHTVTVTMQILIELIKPFHMAAKLHLLPKTTQYKYTTMTAIFHFVFQLQFQDDIAPEC